MQKTNFEDRTNLLLRYLTDYIYTVTIKNGTVSSTYHGPGCQAVTGYTSEEYEKEPNLWLKMVHQNDKNSVVDQAKRATSGEQVKPLEHRIIHKDGFTRWVKNSIVLSKDEDGNIIYYDGLINDITDLKRAEENNAVKQKQLIQADKMASLGVLVSGIAHEINNPNNFIMLNGKFLEKVWKELYPIWINFLSKNESFMVAGNSSEKLEESIKQSLNGIIEGVNRISKITRSLTDYAKQDHGKLDDEININGVVKNALLITGNLIKKSTSKFNVKYSNNLPKIIGNTQQLEQVVINLINNACQSINNKSKPISIYTYLEKNKYVVIEVVDEGVGIDKETLNKIFDPFFTTKRNYGGTGLGLSISYNIIQHHNGQLNIKSKLGEGTECCVKIPFNKFE